MNNFPVLLAGLVFVAVWHTYSSLWESPPQWRTPRLTEGGIFHRLLASLLRAFFMAFCFITFNVLAKNGAPSWLVNLPRRFVPNALMRAAARAWEPKQEKRP